MNSPAMVQKETAETEAMTYPAMTRSLAESSSQCRAMADVKHDDHVLGLIDLVQHLPLAAQAGAVDPGQLRAKRLADPPWTIEEGSGDELDRCAGDLER